MTITEILLSRQLVLALVAYAALSVLEAVLTARLHPRPSKTTQTGLATRNLLFDVDPGVWLWARIYAPLLRAGALLAFMLIAYPTLFGLSEMPSVTALLGDQEGRFGSMLGVIFLLALALPLLPVIGTLPALILPLQGAAAAAMLFRWLSQNVGAADVSYWPGSATVLGMVVVSVAAYWIATRVARIIERVGHKHLEVADLGELVFEALLLFLQAPAVILYATALGRQLAD